MEIQEWLGKDNQLGIDIWTKKYQHNGESFEEWLDRVSGGNESIREIIKQKKFLFGGRILSNRGLHKEGKKVTYSNCYVITPLDDNLESIFECASKLARTYSYGGGCGIDISELAPRGAEVNNTAKYTTGAVSFMDLYSLVTGLIGQNGRRGALMITISCDHPDLLEFIGIKQDLDKVTKANISIRITDDFMIAVMNKETYLLSFYRHDSHEMIQKEIDAYEVFKIICESNWDFAEPGVLFWDTIESWNLLSCDPYFRYAGTNPCAEEPLPAGGSCLLGSINLAEFVRPNGSFDIHDFTIVVHHAVTALNEVLDEGLPLHPLEEQRESVRQWRQIGLGIFGLSDMLIKMGLTYGSPEAIDICDTLGFIMADQAIQTSAKLAREFGPYPGFNKEAVLQSKYYKENISGETQLLVEAHGLRNSQLLTIAPTGTLSTMLGVSGGIEPIFANYYERKTESLHGKDVYYKVYTPIVQEYMKNNNISDDKDLPDFFVTSRTIPHKNRIDMQATWQRHIDASISSTVNVPNEFTVDDVIDLYIYAWEKGLKGVTIFREGCKRSAILSTSPEQKEEKEEKTELSRGYIIKASDNCIGKKKTLYTGCGTLHCEAFFDPETGELRETYLSKGSSGGCNNFMIGLSRMISLSARGGVDIHTIVDQLKSSGTCPSYAVRTATKKDTSKGSSCPVAVGNALLEMYNELNKIEIKKNTDVKNACPECGEELIFEGGCNTCKNCGWSKCD